MNEYTHKMINEAGKSMSENLLMMGTVFFLVSIVTYLVGYRKFKFDIFKIISLIVAFVAIAFLLLS